MRRKNSAHPADSITSNSTGRAQARRSAIARVSASWCTALAAASAALLVHAAAAQEAPTSLPEHDEWILFGGPEVAMFGHTGRGRTTGSELDGPRVSNPSGQRGDLGTTIVEPFRNRRRILSFLLGGNIGVMTPALELPSHPRLSFDLSLSVPMTTEVHFNRFGSPGAIAFPANISPTVPAGEGLIEGTGNELTAQHQGPQVHATLAPSFELALGPDERLRVKPGLTYSRLIVDIAAVTNRAVRLNNDSGTANGLEDSRYILLSATRTEVYHALGPSLEVDYDPGIEWGPIRVGLYGKAHAGYTFGDLVTEMQESNPDYPAELVRWKYVQDRWFYRIGTGIRIFWSPKF